VSIAYTLRLDPVAVLRDPDRTNYYLRRSAATIIWKRQAEAKKNMKQQTPRRASPRRIR